MHVGTIRKLEGGLLFTSILAYLISLALPAMYVLPRGQSLLIKRGAEVLILGWGGIFYLFSMAWYANPFYFFSAVVLLANRRAGKSGDAAIALVSMLLGFSIGLTAFRLAPGATIAHSSGYTEVFQSFGLGCYFWIASLFLLFVGSIITFSRTRIEEKMPVQR